MKNQGKKWTAENDAELAELAKTYTSSEIAEIMERTHCGVRQRCMKLGIHLIAYRNDQGLLWTETLKTYIKKLRDKGLSHKEIGEVVGCPRSAVSQQFFKMDMRAEDPIQNAVRFDPFRAIHKQA